MYMSQQTTHTRERASCATCCAKDCSYLHTYNETLTKTMPQLTNILTQPMTHATPTGWRRPIGCLQLQVIFAKEPLITGLFCGK